MSTEPTDWRKLQSTLVEKQVVYLEALHALVLKHGGRHPQFQSWALSDIRQGTYGLATQNAIAAGVPRSEIVAVAVLLFGDFTRARLGLNLSNSLLP